MPASRLRAFLELSIDGAERAASIMRRHSCAWQAVSDSHARSSGSSSRPSGVIRRSPRKEKPAQGPVRSIRWCGSNSIMPRSHPWPGTEDAGKSRARGPAIAMQSQQRPRFDEYAISHNVYYVLARLARATAARAQPALQAPPSNGRPNTGRTAPHRPSPSHPVSKRPRVGSAHHLRTGLAMRLADFIERNAREILDDAVAFAETQAPDTVEFSAKQLRNHLPQILQAVIDDLRSPQTDSSQSPTGLHR